MAREEHAQYSKCRKQFDALALGPHALNSWLINSKKGPLPLFSLLKVLQLPQTFPIREFWRKFSTEVQPSKTWFFCFAGIFLVSLHLSSFRLLEMVLESHNETKSVVPLETRHCHPGKETCVEMSSDLTAIKVGSTTSYRRMQLCAVIQLSAPTADERRGDGEDKASVSISRSIDNEEFE